MTPQPGHFSVRTELIGPNVRLGVAGELDIATLPALTDAVAAVRDEALEHLVVDLRDLTFLDSMSIEYLLRLHADLADKGTELVVVRGPRGVDRLFELMELGRVLTIVDQLPDYVTPG